MHEAGYRTALMGKYLNGYPCVSRIRSPPQFPFVFLFLYYQSLFDFPMQWPTILLHIGISGMLIFIFVFILLIKVL